MSRRGASCSTSAQIAYDSLIVATGATHAYFGNDEWQAHAPRAQDARRCAGNQAAGPAGLRTRRARARPARRSAPADVRRRRRRTRPASRWRGPLAEIARHALRHEFPVTSIPSRRASCCSRAAPTVLTAFPEGCGGVRGASRCATSASRSATDAAVTRIEAHRVSHRRAVHRGRDRPVGGGRGRIAARSGRSACRSTAPGASSSSPT